jgi:hypothetical protein
MEILHIELIGDGEFALEVRGWKASRYEARILPSSSVCIAVVYCQAFLIIANVVSHREAGKWRSPLRIVDPNIYHNRQLEVTLPFSQCNILYIPVVNGVAANFGGRTTRRMGPGSFKISQYGKQVFVSYHRSLELRLIAL